MNLGVLDFISLPHPQFTYHSNPPLEFYINEAEIPILTAVHYSMVHIILCHIKFLWLKLDINVTVFTLIMTELVLQFTCKAFLIWAGEQAENL